MSWFMRNGTGAGTLATADATASAYITEENDVGTALFRAYTYNGTTYTLRASSTNALMPSSKAAFTRSMTIPADIPVTAGQYVVIRFESDTLQRNFQTAALSGYTIKAGTHSIRGVGVSMDTGMSFYVKEFYYGAGQSYAPDALLVGSSSASFLPIGLLVMNGA